jgi:hypothetical protein
MDQETKLALNQLRVQTQFKLEKMFKVIEEHQNVINVLSKSFVELNHNMILLARKIDDHFKTTQQSPSGSEVQSPQTESVVGDNGIGERDVLSNASPRRDIEGNRESPPQA